MNIKYFGLCIIAFMAFSLSMSAAVNLSSARESIDNGDYDVAISKLNELASKEPRNSTIPQLLGDCYLALNKDSEAITQYKKAVKTETMTPV